MFKREGRAEAGMGKEGVQEGREPGSTEQALPVLPQIILQNRFPRITGTISIRDLLLSGKLSVEKKSCKGSIKGY